MGYIRGGSQISAVHSGGESKIKAFTKIILDIIHSVFLISDLARTG
jgi:hypothetical protein